MLERGRFLFLWHFLAFIFRYHLETTSFFVSSIGKALMDLKLRNKVALITGGSKGIGKAIASALAEEGCNVAICARNQEELEEASRDLRPYHVEVLAVKADLAREEDITELVEQTTSKFQRIDILVNNAGIVGKQKTFEALDTEDWRRLFEVNLFAVVTLIRKVIPFMRKNKWGRIINISSENGEQPYSDMPHYSVSKGALNNLTKMLSKAYAQEGILINTVSPAFIKTPLVDKMMQNMADQKNVSIEEAYQQFLKSARPGIAVGRPGNAEEVGKLVAFLASEQASFINGANFRIDGGSVATL